VVVADQAGALQVNDPTSAKPLAVTVQTASRLTGLGKTTIYELIKDGTLSAMAVGRRRLIRYASLEALIGKPAGEAGQVAA
jgi:excisionase family DNA binding protein